MTTRITTKRARMGAALYGSTAANGVIVIKTKRGAAQDGIKLNYRSEYGMDSALAAMQRAIDNTNTSAAAPGGFTIPGAWVPSPTVWNSTEFIKMIRSYRARFRANVARTPAERAAADWTAIIADAQNGFTGDHLLSLDATNGPFAGWRRQYDPGGSSWHQMPPFVIGMFGEQPGRAAPILLLMFINIHHYFTDGVIWKISNADVRRDLFAHVPRADVPASGGGIASPERGPGLVSRKPGVEAPR